MTEMEAQALHDPGVRERLLRAAIALFARKGYAGTTVREIVEAAGVTKPVLYYYFHSKEGIFQELASRAISAHDTILEEVRRTPGGPTAKIRLLFDSVFVLIQQNVDVVRVLDAVYYGPREGAPPFDFERLYGSFHKALRDLVEDGIRCGELRPGDLDIMTMALLGGWVIAEDTSNSCHKHEMGADGMRRITDLILDGLRVDQREQGEAR